ncbi:AraC family transcriptional regulator [Paucibacter sp. O1-1]|nr:AraC family transcriptional regulator [Paucibacter sp. O1-1]MDA3825534.1 AraC family transcriptional regulator [Paucibacter sp. O1-1]
MKREAAGPERPQDQPDNDPRSQATLVPAVARVLLGLVEDRGMSSERLCRGLGFNPHTLAQDDVLISHQQTRALILRAQRELGEPALGLAVGARETPISWGLAGLAMLSCETLGEAVSYGLERQTGTGSMIHHQLTEDGERFHISATPHVFDLEIETFLVEEAFSSAVAVTRAMVGASFRPLQVDFAYACPANPRLYERFFRCPVRFDADEHRLTVDIKWLEARLPGYDRLTSDLVRKQLNQLLKVPIGQDDLLASVVNRIRYGLQDRPSQRALAAQVNVSERTLRRRLVAQEASYSGLRDETRYERARDLLINTPMSIAEVAQALGYADARSFRRAFKRWSGVLPTALRGGG